MAETGFCCRRWAVLMRCDNHRSDAATEVAVGAVRLMGERLKTITVTGFKGGVGRTTGAAALAQGLSALGHNVALIDAGHAVPVQELVRSERRGRGSPPDESLLQKWAGRLACNHEAGPSIQYIRVSTAAYLEAVMEQLWREDWHFAVVDTPAHPTASVFEATDQSSLLLLPAWDDVGASAVKDMLPDEFLDGYHTIRCLVTGSRQPESVRQAFAPLRVLETELQYEPKLYETTASSSPCGSSVVPLNDWHRNCLCLAREVADQIKYSDETTSARNASLLATGP